MRISALTVAILILALPGAYAGPVDPHTVVVAGQGEVQAAPDRATVEIGVVTSDKLPSNALNANAALMQRVIAAIGSVGIPSADIRTSLFSIEPQHPRGHDYVVDFSIVSGYEVTNKLTVTVKDLDKVGQVIDAAVRSGANSSNSVSFDVSDRKQYYDQALARAVGNARHNAEIMAGAGQQHVGKMISVTDAVAFNMSAFNNIPPPPPPPPPPPVYGTVVLPGQITIRANVVVTFSLE